MVQNKKTFFSQKGQDKWVVHDIFNYKTNGFFVDLACANGKNINNTYFLEKNLNWNGICIEPMDEFYNQAKKNRNVKVIKECVDSFVHEIEFRTDYGMGSGIVDDDTDNNISIRYNDIQKSYNNGKIKKIITTTLEKILDTNNAPKMIDYLSLDVEGSETRILRNFPFDKYIFLSITIERPTEELNEILFKNGYVFVKNVSYDTFYVHESLDKQIKIQKENFEQIPKKNW